MTTITGADTYFTLINSDLTATEWEACIDQAIDKINGYAGDDVLPNMTGTAGSKELSVSSMEAGFIRQTAVAVYNNDFKNAGAQSQSVQLGSMSMSSSGSNSSMGAGGVEDLAQTAARHLLTIESDLG